MTRDWVFTLPLAGFWYNLWDLIVADPSFTDPIFSNAPFIPSMVCNLKFQNQTPGSNIYRTDSKKEVGFGLSGGSWDEDRSDRNVTDLKNQYFSTDTAGASLYVKIIAN